METLTTTPPGLSLGDELGDLGLTYGQRALWFLDRLSPGDPAYVIAGAARVRGGLDPGALLRATAALSARHPALRTTFHEGPAGPVQRVGIEPQVDLHIEDGAGLDEAALARRLGELAYRPFDLSLGPLWRLALLRLDGGGYALALSIHHIVADFWSLGVMLRDLGALYGEELALPSPLPEPAVGWADLVRQEEESLAGPEGERLWQFWRAALAGMPRRLELPTDRPRPAVPTHRRGSSHLGLTPAVAQALRRSTRRRGATLYMGLLAAFEVLLKRYSGQDRLVVGCPTSGRKTPELAGIVGYLVNPVAIATDLSGDPTFAELLARVRTAALAAFAHRDYPLPLLAERLQPEREAGSSPVFQVMCVLQKGRRAEEEGLAALAVGETGGPLRLGPLELETVGIESPGAQFDLSLALAETARGITGRLGFDRDLFETATVARMAGHLEALLAPFSDNSEPVDSFSRRLSHLTFLSAAERHQLLLEWSTEPWEDPGGDLLHELFADQVARTPEAPAIGGTDGWLTYGELDARADRLARRLRALGVGPETLVGICLIRSFDRVVGVIAVLKAGGAYLPLDPGLPTERLALLAEDGRLAALLAEAATADLLPAGGVPRLWIDTADEEAAALPPLPRPAADPDHPAYVLHTSGSTGRPKGVVISHRAITARMRFAAAGDLLPGERMIQKTTLAFDVSVFEIFAPLLTGGLIVAPEPGRDGDPAYILSLAAEQAVTRLAFPPLLLSQFLEQEALLTLSPRVVATGAETVPPDLPARFHARMKAELHHRYGPTEATISVTSYRCPPGAETLQRLPIGRPIAVSEIYLLDAAFQPVPIGVSGELCIGGACLARGYLHRPEQTAAVFVPHPFPHLDRGPGARLYRTGDMARHRPDGEIEFLGRIDGQVKVRGFRVELGEIEAALREHPAVERAVVADREDPGMGSRRLVAWLVPRPGGTVAVAEVRQRLAAKLPGYMVPAVFVIVDSLPLMPSGKVDRRALPEPEEAGEARGRDGGPEAPRTPLEELLLGLWSDLLGSRRIGREDSFFDLGGHSLLATRLVARVREALGVELPLRAIFEAPTLARFAARLSEELAAEQAGAGPLATPLRPFPRSGPLPLSFAQERLWFLDRLQPGSPTYNLPGALDLRGKLDREAFAASLREIVRRHAALRTSFAVADGRPVQVVAEPGSPEMTVALVELADLPPVARAVEAGRLTHEEALLPFDLERGPLLRAALLRLGEESHRALLTMHHIVSDGWSIGVLLRELAALYGAYVEGRRSPLPELPVQYADYAVWQRGWLSGPVLERQLAWWRERLTGMPEALELPADRPRPALASLRGGSLSVALPDGLVRDLASLAGQRGVTPFMVLLTAFAALLTRLSGQERVVAGSVVANRTHREVEELIGFFVNTLPLPVDLMGDPPLSLLLGQVRETALAAYAHQDVPFEKLVQELAPRRSLAWSPLFQAMLVLQNAPSPRLALPGLTAELAGLDSGTEKFDLTLSFTPREAGMAGVLSWSADLFERTTAERFAGWFRALLSGALARPEGRVSELPLLDEAQRAELLQEWNDTAGEGGGLVHELFATQARLRPGATAVTSREGRLTYGELATLSGRLAYRLRGLGVGPEVTVVVLLGATPWRVVAVLAVLEAGGAYIPLDPDYPRERLAFVLADARPAVILTERALAGSLPGLPAAVAGIVTVDHEIAAGPPAPRPAPAVHPDNLAYVIYTSGSTGRPKGVELRHGGLANLVRWHRERYGVRPEDRATLVASPGFDAAVWELWPYLASGASVHLVAAEERLSPAAVIRLWAAERVTLSFLPTPLAEAVLEEIEGGLPAGIELELRALLTGGDRLHRGPAAGSPFRLQNHYGPSEYSVVTTVAEAPAGVRSTPPIGRPVGNTRVAVVGPHGEAVPPGAAGELQVSGAGLARGYLGRPDLTAERFVPDPLAGASSTPGSRAYRTGDRVRFLADGRLEFLGRLDRQVKIRGFRIEPGEVEAVLLAHPAVEQAAVVVREDRPGDRRLVAYFVGGDGPDLRSHCRERLPELMVPTDFVRLSALPLTAHGKLDSAALPAPEGSPGPGGEAARPLTPAEEIMARLWAEVLGIGEVRWIGREDRFFDLGGHSLLATRLLSRVRQAFGVDLPLRAVFEEPTLAGLAAAAERALAAGSGPVAPPIHSVPREGRELPLSFAQERLWFLDQLDPGSPAYNLPAALRLRGPLNIPALATSFAGIVGRHEALRTTFSLSDAEGEGRPVQVVITELDLPLPLADLGALPPGDREAELRRLSRAEAARGFDLARGPLLRTTLLRLAEGEHVLLFTMHHIVSDGWSLEVLVRELGALYESGTSGRPSPLPDLALQYGDFALWQRGYLSGEVLERQLAYWREALAGLTTLALPTDRPRPPRRRGRGAFLRFRLSEETSQGLERLSRTAGSTLFMTLLAGFSALLARYTGQDDLAVGTAIANRTRREVEGLIGFFVNTLVLRALLGQGGDPVFKDLLVAVRRTALAAYAHQEVPFERVVEELSPRRDPSRTPLFQVMLLLQNAGQGALTLPGLAAERLDLPAGTAKFDLTLALAEGPAGLSGGWEYDRDLFDVPTVARLAGHFESLLAGAVAEPGARLSDLPLLSAAERLQLTEWSTGAPLHEAMPPGLCLHELFLTQARRTPGAEALLWGEERLGYGELAARVVRLAGVLRALGVGPESRVAVCLERTPVLPVALLAVLAAGGAYVPLDPAYPRERLGLMLADSGARWLLTQAEMAERLPVSATAAAAECQPILLDRSGLPAPEMAESGEEVRLSPDNLAYLIYTSGSTGVPKGVAISHGSAVALAHWARDAFSPEELSGVLFATSVCFDLSIFELFVPLSWGGRVILADDALALPRLPARDEVRLINTVPSAMAELVRQGAVPVGVRTVNLAGERLPGPLVEALYGLPQVKRVWNLYGPSEDTTYSTAALQLRETGREPGIGQPLPGTRSHVLDRAGGQVPAGVPAELYLGGAGLARGYLGDPEKTAERFVPDLFGEDPGSRLYRTGDLVRHRVSGDLEFLGRIDGQVKVRGFRVEPGEIEAVLGRHPEVREVVVLAREDAPGDRRLVAYVVARKATGEAAGDMATRLRAHAAERLPAYLVPAAFVVLAALPLSPNRKVDRRALPAPEWRSEAAHLAPRTPVEEVLADLWQQVLGCERVGVRDDFFQMGGHSLLATRLASRVRGAFQVNLPLRRLFEAPTIETLAAAVVAAEPKPGQSERIARALLRLKRPRKT